MDGRLRDGVVVVGGDARQRFYDASGYGRPLAEGLALAPVEAAHLLYRGDLDAVLVGRDGRVERLDFRGFLAAGAAGFAARFLVYKDLRDRGFYLSPRPEPRTDVAVDRHEPPADVAESGLGARAAEADVDFAVHPRGTGPWDGEVRYRVRAVGERAPVPAADLGDLVLAVVDEESELTYLETDALAPEGTASTGAPAVEGQLLDDGVLVWDPPTDLHEGAFYGQPFGQREGGGAIQLSLVEAAYLAARGTLTLAGDGAAAGSSGTTDPGQPGGPAADAPPGAEEAVEAIVAVGRAAEGERFDRRLRAYRALRDAGLVPKTGFKFGADFRVYTAFDGLDDLGHSEYLVRCLEAGHVFPPRELALDVRLAGGVRKRMVFARPVGEGLEWVVVERLTP
ncbi:MAG: tRNA-intron lyase [Halobacteriaceae archaeon]